MGCGNSKVADIEGKAPPVMLGWKDRKCRDVLWIILFAAYWVGMVVVFISGYNKGDPARLLFATDSHGNQCGGKTSDCVDGSCGRFIVYPRMDKDIVQATANGITNPLEVPYFGLCVQSCPEGLSDMDGDGQVRDWVCDYDTIKELNTLYKPAEGEPRGYTDIPTQEARRVLGECQVAKNALPVGGAFADALMSDSQDIGNGQTAKCKTYLGSCYRLYVPERSLFFRCIPQAVSEQNCTSSPYMESVLGMAQDEIRATPASHPSCGVCIDPLTDDSGRVMDPDASECKAKRIGSAGVSLEAATNPVATQINSWTALLQRWMGDIQRCSTWIVVSGGAGAIVVGVVWLILLRYFAGVFVWTIIWALLLCFTFLTVQLLMFGGVINAEAAQQFLGTTDIFATTDAEEKQMYMIAGYAMLAVTAIYLLLILTLSRKIRIAVQVLREATKVVATMPMIMGFPIITVSLSLAAGAYWAYVSLLISSAGGFSDTDLAGLDLIANATAGRPSAVSWVARPVGPRTLQTVDPSGDLGAGADEVSALIVKEFKSMDLATYMWLYNFFGYLWTNQLITAFSACTISGAVSSHYWASEFENEKRKKMPRNPVFQAVRRTLRFHMGSLIFGSFVIAIVQLIRALLAYLDKQTQTLQKTNKAVKLVMKVLQCILWCFEKILKFITKHAYIQIALKGTSFCTATRDGFFLLLANLAKIGVATAINNLILLFAKLVISAGAAALCWFTVTTFQTGEDAPSTALVPSAVATLLAWFVGSLFMSVYGLAVDTILVCFCEDEKANDGSPNRPYYMSEGLRRVARKSNKVYKKEMASRNAATDDGGDDDDDDDGSSSNKADAKSAPPKAQAQPSGADLL